MPPLPSIDGYAAFDHCRFRLPTFPWDRAPDPASQLHRLALELSHPRSLGATRPTRALAAAIYLPCGTRQLLRSFGRQARAARRIHHVPYHRQLAGLLHTVFRRNAAPDCYYIHRLFRPGDLRRLPAFFEHRELQSLLRALHATLDTDAIADKLRCHELCRQHALPTPPLWAVFRAGAIDAGRSGPWLANPRADLFVKPAADYSGHGVVRWCHDPATGRYCDGRRQLDHGELTAETAARSLAGSTFIIQPRLAEGPALADLAGGSVCNYRILTGCAPDTDPVVLTAVLRLPSPGHYLTDVDNDILAAPVAIGSGTLGSAQSKAIERGIHRRHPRSGAPIEGRVVPNWPAVAALARRAHAACAWMPFVGWDIVDTTEGPTLLEANAYWGGNLCQMSGHRFLGETEFPTIFLAHLARLRPDLVQHLHC